MELRVLRYFLMAAREENITRAAEKLHITQPTLSRQLMQLEEDLGTTLFHRNNHRIVLTEDGMLLKRRAQELLELAEKTQREFQSREELSGEIAIGCGETCNMASLSDWMVSFREQHPLVQFRIYSATADEVKERMENGLLDMGLMMKPVEVQKYSYALMPYQERWAAMVREDSPLAQLSSVALCYDLGTTYYNSLRLVPLSPTLENGAVLAWKKDLPRSRAVEQFIAHIKNSAV